jgi:hypothetical protein
MERNKIAIVAVAAIAVIVIAGFYATRGEPSLSIESPVIMPSKMMKGAAVFMDIYNDGKGSDYLVGFSIEEFPTARTELHDVVGGKMQVVKSIKIPAGKMTELKAGTLHLMAFDLPDVEEWGEELTLVLKFQKSGEMQVKAKVMKTPMQM